MIYVICWLCPPLSLLFAIRPISAILNGLIWIVGVCLLPAAGLGLLLVIPCIIHACSTISGDNFRRGNNTVVREVKALRKQVKKSQA